MKTTARAFLAVIILAGGQPLLGQIDQRTENIVKGVNFIGLAVSDLDKAVDFYQEGANLETVETSEVSENELINTVAGRGITARTALLKSSNAQLRFMEFAAEDSAQNNFLPVEVHGPGIAHLCFQVADTTETYQRFVASGAEPIGAPEMVQLNPRNPVVYAYARDPDGTIMEVEHIDFSKVTTERKNDYRIRHVSLASPNIERMVDFYSGLLEEPAPRRVGQGGTLAGENFDRVSGYEGTKMEMAWFQVRNLELEIVQYHSHPTTLSSTPRSLDALGLNMIMFDVDNVTAARAAVLSAGGNLVTEIGSWDGGATFFARDPDGNLLGFQSFDESSNLSSQNFADNGV